MRNGATPIGPAIGSGYDNASRLQTVTQGTLNATYTRSPMREVIGQIAFSGGAALTNTQGYDGLGRFTSGSLAAGATTLSGTTYGFNPANQRTRADREDGTHWTYGYDDLGQVTSGVQQLATNETILGREFAYQFDRIGNRTQTTVNGQSANYTPNLLNQSTQREVPGVADIAGRAEPTATVTVNDQPTARQGDRFFKQLPAANSAAAVKVPVTITGVKNNVGALGEDAVTAQSGSVFVPKTPEVFFYDDDGNLTSDGQWTYTWDGENRLVSMETTPAAISAGMPKRKLTFAYDGQSRRVEKAIYDWNLSTLNYELSTRTKFIYDGWNLLAETDGSNTVQRRYVWGLDLSGSEQGAGGVGGLIFIHTTLGDAIPAYDGNGNITALVNATTGAVVARYEYGPFGEPLRATGPMARGNPFRFSTKYADEETGLCYYGYRYYQPQTGRWINRDPIGERGGENLYGFVSNDPLGLIDVLGLSAKLKCTRCKKSGIMRCRTIENKKISDVFTTNEGKNNEWRVPEGTYDLEPKPEGQMNKGNENLHAPDDWNGYPMQGPGGAEYPIGTPSITGSGREPGCPANGWKTTARVHGPGLSHGCTTTDKANDIRKMMDRNPKKTKMEIKDVKCKCVNGQDIPADDPDSTL